MIKVLIVVSGVVMFVPDAPPNPQGMTALLVETKYAQGMTPHVPALRQQIDSSYRGWNIEDTKDFKALFRVAVKDRPGIDPGAKTYFPQLDQLTVNPADAKVDSSCLNGECTDKNGKKRIAGVVRFEGGWRTRPLQRCDKKWNLPVGFGEKAKSDFRKVSDLKTPKVRQDPRPLATGLGLEAEIERIEDLHLEIKGVLQTLQPTSPASCKEWLDTSDPCIVFEVESWAIPIVSVCDDVTDPPPPCRIDQHFAMFYDLIVKPPDPGDRWLPYVSSKSDDLTCPSRKDQKPAIRCPPTFSPR